MARAALCWSLRDLSIRSGVSIATINRLEQGGRRKTTPANLAVIRRAFEAEGIVFLVDESRAVGVKLMLAVTYHSDEVDEPIRTMDCSAWSSMHL